jgi:hypothetical protein
MDVVGGNAHTCHLDGTIVAGVARLPSVDSDPQNECVVDFKVGGASIEVTTANRKPCRQWCGARAWFEGTYLRPAPACQHAKVAADRKRFRQAYDRKAYPEARALLEPIFTGCQDVLDIFERMWIRNDLALTLHQLKQDARCVEVLTPLKDYVGVRDEDVSGGEPAYAEELQKIARATRHNLKLCGDKPAR